MSAEISTGAILRPEQIAVIQSKSLLYSNTRVNTVMLVYSCEGKYSFIGNGTGGDNKITFAEAWQGK